MQEREMPATDSHEVENIDRIEPDHVGDLGLPIP